jgi:nucleotide-binding universal stress UspA family protein
MSKYNIVLAVDFSPTSDVAIAHALEVARRVEADVLHLVHVVPALDVKRPGGLREQSELIEMAYTNLRAYVQDHAKKLGKGQWSQDVVSHVRLGDPAECIHQVAVDVDADLVIVGSHQRKGLAKLMLGSVAEKLIGLARVPVMVACEKNFEGLPRTERPDPPRPGEDLSVHTERPESRAETFILGARTSHISGLL